jgi:hypothetical protein
MSILLSLMAWMLGLGSAVPQASASPASPSVRIEVRDDGFALPANIKGGLATFAVENHGSEPHEARFARLTGGKTVGDFSAWLKTGTSPPAWLVNAGGIAALAPGGAERYSAALAPGTYVVFCSYLAEDGVPHVEKGAFAAFRVAPGSAGPRPTDADLTVTLRDHGFQLSAPVPGGHPVWHLRNTGTETHYAVLVHLPAEGSEYPERAWFSAGGRGPRIGQPAGGVVELAPDTEAWFRVELPPGRYLLLCPVKEEEGRHFDLGMIYRFAIE